VLTWSSHAQTVLAFLHASYQHHYGICLHPEQRVQGKVGGWGRIGRFEYIDACLGRGRGQ
jgi:hypothetical protein